MRQESFSGDELAPIPFAWPDETGDTAGRSSLSKRSVDQPLRPETKYGVFHWWVERMPAWIHPDDIQTASEVVPSDRVFRREQCENYADRELGYSDFFYGESRIRALPGLWLEVETDGYEVGDLVEIKSQYGKLRPQIASIIDIVWNRNSRMIEYRLETNGHPIGYSFSSEDIQPAFRLGEYLTPRELEIAALNRFK